MLATWLLLKAVRLGGQVEFTTPGTYYWTVPDEVFSVCAVAVGGGGGASSFWGLGGAGGGGGALAYINNFIVEPGQVLTVSVGDGGLSNNSNDLAGNGGDSYIADPGNTVVLKAVGGGGASGAAGVSVGGSGADCIGQAKFSGGAGGKRRLTTVNNKYSLGGGGGAGGYSGVGGVGGGTGFTNTGTPLGSGNNGLGGAGGGGGEGGSTNDSAGFGGGVGLKGQGSNGAGGTAYTYVSSGVDGGAGSGGNGRLYGGGAGAQEYGSSNGSNGAVRIIWGPGRAFPSTSTGDV